MAEADRRPPATDHRIKELGLHPYDRLEIRPKVDRMSTNNVSTRHVRQVAELVQRLNRDEIRELLRLVPKLQVEAATTGQPANLVQWASEQMAQHAYEARPMQDEDTFLEDKTVAEYFALYDPERERIWAELYAVAIESALEREVEPDAIVSAR